MRSGRHISSLARAFATALRIVAVFAFGCSSQLAGDIAETRASAETPVAPPFPCPLNPAEFRRVRAIFDGKLDGVTDIPGVFRCVRQTYGAATEYTPISRVRLSHDGLTGAIVQGATIRQHLYAVVVFDRKRMSVPALGLPKKQDNTGFGPDILITADMLEGRTGALRDRLVQTIFYSTFPHRRNQASQLASDEGIRLVMPAGSTDELDMFLISEFERAELMEDAECDPSATTRVRYLRPLCVCQAKLVGLGTLPADPFGPLGDDFSPRFRRDIADKMVKAVATVEGGWAMELNGKRNEAEATCKAAAAELFPLATRTLPSSLKDILRSQWDRDLPPGLAADVEKKVDASLPEAMNLFQVEVGVDLKTSSPEHNMPAGWNKGYCAFFPLGLNDTAATQYRQLVPVTASHPVTWPVPAP